jgi:hypothetical protein
MSRIAQAWTRYWFTPAPLFDLAVARVAIVGTQLFGLLVMTNHHWVLSGLAGLPDELYDPLPVLHLMVAPLDWRYRPGFEVLETIHWLTVACGVTSLLGLFTNVSLAGFACGNVFLQAFEYSFGEFHHNDEVMMVALVVLALSPCGRSLSLDGLRRSRKEAAHGSGRGPLAGGDSPFARWPLLVIRWMFVLAYLSAAFHKLKAAGLDWMNGYTLQWYMLEAALRYDLPLGVWVGHQLGLVVVLSWVTVLWEATFFLVLFVPALAWIYVPVGVGFHVGTWVLMQAAFYQYFGLYSVFVPWAAAYAWLLRRRRGRKPAARGAAHLMQPEVAG